MGNATLVLVQPYDALVGARTRKDKHLNLFPVRTRPHLSSKFFSVEFIVCGAVLVEDCTQPGDYLVIDTIDTDMFLCIQKMHRDAGHGALTMQWLLLFEHIQGHEGEPISIVIAREKALIQTITDSNAKAYYLAIVCEAAQRPLLPLSSLSECSVAIWLIDVICYRPGN